MGFHRLLFGSFLMIFVAISLAEERWLRTIEGCSLYLGEEYALSSVSWSGSCVSGKVDGVGRLSVGGSNATANAHWARFASGRRVYPYYFVLDDVAAHGVVDSEVGENMTSLNGSDCLRIPACKELLEHKFGVVTVSNPSTNTQTPTEISESLPEIAKSDAGEYFWAIIEYCDKAANYSSRCLLHFMPYKNGENPRLVKEQYFHKDGDYDKDVKVLADGCGFGWFGAVTAGRQGRSEAEGKSCGAASKEEALEIAFKKCADSLSINCKQADKIRVAWGSWSGEKIAYRPGDSFDHVISNGGTCTIHSAFGELHWSGENCSEDAKRILLSLGVRR